MSKFKVGQRVRVKDHLTAYKGVDGEITAVRMFMGSEPNLDVRLDGYDIPHTFIADELSPADPVPTATDELQQAREAYDDAQESLSEEFSTEFGEVVALRNALEAADELIIVLEALSAARQQRIGALENALEPLDKIWAAWREYAVNHMDYPSDFHQWLHGLLSSSREHAMYQAAYEALHADENGE